MISVRVLQRIMPASGDNAVLYCDHLSMFADEGEINTPARMAAFLAQVAVESGQLRFVSENLNYSAAGLLATFPRRYTGELAALHSRKPELIANHVYGGRYGNEHPGDGWRFRGRGLKQITFKDNYRWISNLKFEDPSVLVENPDLLLEPGHATRSAALFWREKDCNRLADIGDFDAVTRAINGGMNGINERRAFWSKAKLALAFPDLSAEGAAV